MSVQSQELPGLVRALRVLRERWWIVVLAAAVCTATTLGWSLSRPKEYTATSQLLFRESNLPEQVGGSSPPPDVDPEATKATNILLVTTTDIAAAVRTQLRLSMPVDELLNQVTVETESNANVVNIAARDGSPRLAAAIANTWADQFTAYSRRVARAKLAEGQDLLRERIRQLPVERREERQSLGQALTRLILLESVQTGDADVLNRAGVPGVPSTPTPKRDAALALLLGSLLGVGLAFVLNLVDRRLKSVEEFEEFYGLRALASIPLRAHDPGSLRERQAALEPFRILRNSLNMLVPSREPAIIMVTSAVAGEGKSTVAAGLARAIALAGDRVVLVEADLRRPTFGDQFALGDDPRGLTSALIGGAPANELLQSVLPGLRTLRVLPSGPLPPNSAELLRSPEMGRILRDLADEADVVVVDAPPLLPVADAQVLLDREEIDACVIVGRAYHTTRDQARRTRSLFDGHAVRHFGLVVNGVRGAEQGYEYYGPAEERTAPGRLEAGAPS